MIVSELIEKLKQMNQEAEIRHLWDGELYTSIDHVYMGKTGICVTAGEGQVAYSDDGRPIDAPSAKEDRYWKTPKKDYT